MLLNSCSQLRNHKTIQYSLTDANGQHLLSHRTSTGLFHQRHTFLPTCKAASKYFFGEGESTHGVAVKSTHNTYTPYPRVDRNHFRLLAQECSAAYLTSSMERSESMYMRSYTPCPVGKHGKHHTRSRPPQT